MAYRLQPQVMTCRLISRNPTNAGLLGDCLCCTGYGFGGFVGIRRSCRIVLGDNIWLDNEILVGIDNA